MKKALFLEKGDTIGLVAPSFGANIEPYKTRLDFSIKYFKKLGYNIKTFGDLYGFYKGASESKENRAKHFMDAYLDKTVKIIWSVSGGELMMEILPLIDFKTLENATPKIFIGYSDNTNLTFTLTTLLNIPSIYAPTFTGFGMENLDSFLVNTLEIIKGNLITQHSSLYHEKRDVEEENPLASYVLTERTKWHNLNGEKEIKLTGRIIGGCFDVLINLVGTKYDNVKKYNEKYKNDGIIFYLETYDFNPFQLKRALIQLKEAGWFGSVKGILFGRDLNNQPLFDITHEEVIKDILNNLNIPIITNMDIGHVKPMITIINGSLVEVVNSDYDSYLKIIK